MSLSKALRNNLLLFVLGGLLPFSIAFGIISGNDPPSSAARTLDPVEKEIVQTLFCDKYKTQDKKTCDPTKQNCVIEGTDPCPSTGRNHCFAAWVNSSEAGFKFVGKGCWLNEDICYGKQQCEPRSQSRDVFFCCCEGDYCNRNITFNSTSTYDPWKTDATTTKLPFVRTSGNSYSKTVLYSIVPILGVAVVVIVIFFIWKRHKRNLYMGHSQLPTVDPCYLGTPSQSLLNLDKIQLIELRARGRFGSVWKAQLLSEYVAVKIFPQQERQSWLTEQDIYNLPQMNHDNILRFIASEKREENPTIELWLLTEFHENGSLFDYLKGHVLTWTQMCHAAETMARGLAFLHDEIPPSSSQASKPAVAHRDFKSKNVLLKADLTACIADFGLALKFEPGKGPGETHGQVGTRRYMAPEVLEGAICFNRDAFLRIDMYACALVLWELLARCNAAEGPVGEYQLPFESAPEIGQHPTLEAMQDYVVTRKMRPPILDHWKQHPGMANIVCTIEECWDQDAEARLSAGCVQERISALIRTLNPIGQGNGSPPIPPLLSTSVSSSQSPPRSADSIISFSSSSDIPPKDLSSC